MAEKIIESNYQSMMEALNNFASRVGLLASEIQTLAMVASSALQDEDVAVPQIYKSIRECTLKYSDLSSRSLKIATAMGEELERSRKEMSVWSDDE